MKVLLHLIIYKAIVLGVCRLVVSSLVLVVLPGAGGGWWSPPWWLPSVEWSSVSGGWWCPPWWLPSVEWSSVSGGWWCPPWWLVVPPWHLARIFTAGHAGGGTQTLLSAAALSLVKRSCKESLLDAIALIINYLCVPLGVAFTG